MNLRIAALFVAVFLPSAAWSANDCSFSVAGPLITLDSDCTTDATLQVPNGMTLDGQGHTIRAVDPADGPFLGAIIENAGATAYVRNLTLYTVALKNVCHGIQDGNAPAGADICDRDLIPDNRLKAIYFRCGGGSVESVRVFRVHQTRASNCLEGSGIEVRNAPDAAPVSVVLRGNTLRQYQKTGILVHGAVEAQVVRNRLFSWTSSRVATNGIQFSAGATGTIQYNDIYNNRFTGPGFASAGILLDGVDDVDVDGNALRGNDVGIWVLAGSGAHVHENHIRLSTLLGIAVDDQSGPVADVVVAENLVTENAYGVGLFGAGTTNTVVSGNGIKDNEVGVYSGPDVPAPVVLNNVVWNGRGDGIVIDGFGAVVEGNMLFANQGRGIAVQGDANVIVRNSVRRSGAAGISIAGSVNTIESNSSLISGGLLGGLDIENIGGNAYMTNVCKTSTGEPVDCGSPPLAL